MRALICGGSLIALALSGAAYAQDAADSTAVDDRGIADIVVTAERISQTAQKAALPISVVSSDDLLRQNITRPEDLSRAVPALSGSNGGGPYSVFFVRGVGNSTLNAYSDPGIAFNYDGVYIGRPSSTSGVFYDLQRVEVLKGPQGTLYGRNATGGAINVIPNRPKLGVTSLDLMASYGNYDALVAQGALNLPIGEQGAFRISGNYARRDGFMNDGTGDQDEVGLRAQVYTELTPDLDLRIAVDYAHQGGMGSFSTYLGSVDPTFGPGGVSFRYTPSGFGPDEGILSPASRQYLAGRFVNQAGRAGEVTQGVPYNNNGYWGAMAEANWRLGSGTFTGQIAYRESDLNNLFTAGMNGAETDEHDGQLSIEARYAGKAGPVDYLVGGYYFRENIQAHAYFSQFTLVPFQDFTTRTDSWAAFGKITLNIGEQFRLTAAGRYTEDKKKFDGVSDVYILFCGNPATQPPNLCPTLPFLPLVDSAAELRDFYTARGIRITPAPLYVLPAQAGGSQTAPFVLNSKMTINSGLKNDKFTYRLAAEYDVGPRSMVYASFETGYHSGGFAFAKGLESYDPETIDAWTIGSKNRFFDNRVQFNIEGFYWKYKDQQYSQFGYDLGTPPTTVFLTRNIGRATIYGVDMDMQAMATETTLLNASLQYVKSKYDSFVYYNPNQGLPPITSCGYSPTTQSVNGSNLNVFRIDCSGKSAFNAPKWSFSAGIQQTVPLNEHKVVLNADTRYRSSSEVESTFSPFMRAESNFVSNASITFAPQDDRWFISAFVNNFTDSRRLVGASLASSVNLYTGSYEPPRTYGVRVGGSF
jgi:iron complex outermembrane receptor protein